MSQARQEFVGVGEAGAWIDAPDRIDGVARLIARQPNGAAQQAMAARVRKIHPAGVAGRIIERAREIYSADRREPAAGHARRRRVERWR